MPLLFRPAPYAFKRACQRTPYPISHLSHLCCPAPHTTGFPLGAAITEMGESVMDKSYRALFGRVKNLEASLYFIQVTGEKLTPLHVLGQNSWYYFLSQSIYLKSGRIKEYILNTWGKYLRKLSKKKKSFKLGKSQYFLLIFDLPFLN